MTTAVVDIPRHKGQFFEVLQETSRTQTAVMTIGPGRDGGSEETHAGDQVIYVIEGEGYDLHWDVEVEIADQYYARIETEPTRWEWKAGNVIWVPQNTVFQHFSTGSKPAKFLVGSNRLFRKLGYQRVVDFELAPEYAAQHQLQIQTDEGRALLQEGALA
jgi:mannose-6-phosphate isomerase-like protein (cupin superfamily)